MKLFKDSNNTIWAFELDGSQDHLITSDMVSITKEESDAIISQKQLSDFNALSYVEKRIAEYPPITDYLDGLVKGDTEQMQAYIDACLVVKAKYPKQ
jgi:hypothetical protein